MDLSPESQEASFSWTARLDAAAVDTKALFRRPRFVLIASVIIGVGIAFSTAILSVARHTIFRNAPVSSPQSLVYIYSSDGNPVEPATLRELGNGRLEALAFHARTTAVVDAAITTRMSVHIVSPNYFDLLGVKVLPGRGFTSSDELQQDQRVMVISDSAWFDLFDRSPDVIGKTVSIESREFTVIGVVPRGFRGLSEPWNPADVWVTSAGLQRTSLAGIRPFAISRESSPGESKQIIASYQGADDNRTRRGESRPSLSIRPINEIITPFEPESSRSVRTLALSAMAIIGSVFFVASFNIASAFAARSTLRANEWAIRRALGASSTFLACHVLVEVLLAVICGGVLGLVGAVGLTKLYFAYNFQEETSGAGVDLAMVSTALLCGVVIAAVISAFPLSRLRRSDGAIRVGSNRPSGLRLKTEWLRFGAILPQVTVATALLTAGGTQISAVVGIANDPGFDTASVVFATTALREGPVGAAEAVPPVEDPKLIFRAVLDDLRDRFVDVKFSLTSILPTAVPSPPLRVLRRHPPSGPLTKVAISYVSDHYFESVGIPFLAGRDFGRTKPTRPTAIISRSVADALWTSPTHAIGQEIGFANGAGVVRDWLEVSGVVADIRALGSAQTRPLLYRAFEDIPLLGGFPLEVIASPPVSRTKAGWRLDSELRKSNRPLQVHRVESLQDELDDRSRAQRTTSIVLVLAGLTGLGLTSLGVFGIVSLITAERRREFAIRLAIGATRTRIISMVTLQILRAVAIGTVLGGTVAFLGLRLAGAIFGIETQYFYVSFVVVAVLMTVVVALAAYLPARRALPTPALLHGLQ